MTQATERPPARATSGRRPLPPLIVLLVLAVIALGVWWNVFRDEAERDARQAAACATATAAAPSLDPATITLRVYNDTDTPGLAQTVSTTLQSRGFTVQETANDPSDRKTEGVGELRFGARGATTASYVALYLPGMTTYRDDRSTDLVDVVIGPDYTAVAAPEDIDAALATEASAAAAC
ncbi:LytR family transcriptional regulator [Modestobacter sp. I12A-02628]|uniref:LytR C-terminal domain-containing protein n=1 Tax=Goekera deserti TaxID=2497753 RepID=A0A7K3WDG2_9ACTN|nr:LytR C-terminal domain-containing protein [Goekera deserti]MPQ96739.1 LytR family transcriptional regulator [Goekera deserti]NDI46947.1 LytR family transcriptional regulator [Goekera deserti]NEL54515.1 LytR C-terminal domain-containing protein [Goekera deserti]